MKKHYKLWRISIQLLAAGLVIVGGSQFMSLTMPLLMVAMLFGGAFFCGWICPFGTLQDLIGHLTSGIKKRKMPVYVQRVMVLLRYVLFAASTFLTLDFVMTLLTYDARANFFSLTSGRNVAIGAYVVMGLYLVAAVFFDRPFCNYMCPEGAKYGLMSSLRPFRMVRDDSKCIQCNLCNKACPMQIDISGHTNVNSLQCINCFECAAACPKKGALKYRMIQLTKQSAVAYGLSIVVALFAGLGAVAYSVNQSQEAQNQSVADQIVAGQINLNDNSTEKSSVSSSTATQPSAAATSSNAYKDGTYTGSGAGFKGDVTVKVSISNGKITDVQMVSNNDDRKWFNRAWQTIPSEILSSQSANVDTVSGATYSSKGIISAVKDALSQAQ